LIPYDPIDAWWCCLRDNTRTALAALLPFYLTNPTYMDRSTFDAIMAVTGVSASTKVLASFMLTYRLQYQLIPCGEDCFIDAVVWLDGWWALLALFATTDGFICAHPCKMVTFPL